MHTHTRLSYHFCCAYFNASIPGRLNQTALNGQDILIYPRQWQAKSITWISLKNNIYPIQSAQSMAGQRKINMGQRWKINTENTISSGTYVPVLAACVSVKCHCLMLNSVLICKGDEWEFDLLFMLWKLCRVYNCQSYNVLWLINRIFNSMMKLLLTQCRHSISVPFTLCCNKSHFLKIHPYVNSRINKMIFHNALLHARPGNKFGLKTLPLIFNHSLFPPKKRWLTNMCRYSVAQNTDFSFSQGRRHNKG